MDPIKLLALGQMISLLKSNLRNRWNQIVPTKTQCLTQIKRMIGLESPDKMAVREVDNLTFSRIIQFYDAHARQMDLTMLEDDRARETFLGVEFTFK